MKVVYSITKLGGKSQSKLSGVGYVSDGNLYIAGISQKDKPYVREFAEVTKYCHKIDKKDANEYKGIVSEVREVELDILDKQGKPTGSTTTKTIEVDYAIWFKEVE